ncbi:hypothetical protein ACJ3XI_06870 [Litorimonas sp. RW-G-Af-16]|uniref:hypothetical protein n=1 Tax=Litorimonas sp. RW-G-Af-16 TaxID=3241168 RepID=UPI00390C9E14
MSTRQEGEVSSARQLINIFESYNWAKEAAEQARLETAGLDSCPAGMSIVREPFVFLHLCPSPDGTVATHCIHTQPTKIFFGLFNSTKTTDLEVEKLSWSTAITAISRFLSADEAWLLRNIKKD